jgi:hypothetical protein
MDLSRLFRCRAKALPENALGIFVLNEIFYLVISPMTSRKFSNKILLTVPQTPTEYDRLGVWLENLIRHRKHLYIKSLAICLNYL